MPERNPYLVLGVDFGTSGDDARHAFAHLVRRIRTEGSVWEKEDLNWALHEIEALETNPADLVSLYRVPADKHVFEPAGEGLFRPPPVPLERRTPPNDPETVVATRVAAAQELDELLVATLAALVTPETAYAVAEEAR